MGNFNATWSVDELYLSYIYPTLDNVSVLIKGVTTNPDVSMDNVQAGIAHYPKDNDPVVTEGEAGRALSTNQSGNVLKDIYLNRSFQVDELIPNAVDFTTAPDYIGDKLVKSASKIANAWSKKGLIKMVDEGTHKALGTASTKSTIYSNIIDTIADFDIANPERAIGANYVIVTPTTLALLRKSDEFVANTQTGNMLTDGLVGSIGGLQVVLSKQLGTILATDLTGYSAIDGIEYIVGAADAFCAPTGFKNFRTIESELYFGTKVQAEVNQIKTALTQLCA